MKPQIKLFNPSNKNIGKVEVLFLIKNYISNANISIGDYTYYHCYTEQQAKEFQNRNIMYHFPFLNDKITIGKFCSIAYKAKFLMNGGNHDYNLLTTFPMKFLLNSQDYDNFFQNKSKGNITIGHDVWIGYDAIIMPGISIGNGAVVGTRSVVTKNVPPYAIVAGNPAKVVKYRFSQKNINEIEKLEWWNWSEKEFNDNWEVLVKFYS